MNFDGHLNDISNSLEVIDNFLSIEECDEILSYIKSLDFNDRQTYVPNYGLKEDLGNYSSIAFTGDRFHRAFFVKNFLNKKVKTHFQPSEVQVNKYEKGHFIPPHQDKTMSLYTVTVPLQTDDKNHLMFGDPEAYYQNMPVDESDKKGMTKSFSDVKGRGYLFKGTNPIHWVPPTNSLRYSAIFLYSLPL
jgi:hypothetical protein